MLLSVCIACVCLCVCAGIERSMEPRKRERERVQTVLPIRPFLPSNLAFIVAVSTVCQ